MGRRPHLQDVCSLLRGFGHAMTLRVVSLLDAPPGSCRLVRPIREAALPRPVGTLDLLGNFKQRRGQEENVALAHQKNEAAGDPRPKSGNRTP